MPPDNYFGPDFPTKQSAGYMFVRLLGVQLIFAVLDALLVFSGDIGSSIVTVPGLFISPLDVVFIQLGVVLNFIIFIAIFAIWQSVEFRISESHIHIDYGFFNYRVESIIDLATVEGTAVRENWLGKLFNYGMIEIYLDAEHKNRVIRLRGLPFPHLFHAYLKTQLSVTRAHRDERIERVKRGGANA